METEYQGTPAESGGVFQFLVRTIQPGVWTMHPGHARMLEISSELQAVSQDGIGLLGIIKSPFDEFEERRKLSDPLTELKQTFYKLYQGKHMKLE